MFVLFWGPYPVFRACSKYFWLHLAVLKGWSRPGDQAQGSYIPSYMLSPLRLTFLFTAKFKDWDEVSGVTVLAAHTWGPGLSPESQIKKQKVKAKVENVICALQLFPASSKIHSQRSNSTDWTHAFHVGALGSIFSSLVSWVPSWKVSEHSQVRTQKTWPNQHRSNEIGPTWLCSVEEQYMEMTCDFTHAPFHNLISNVPVGLVLLLSRVPEHCQVQHSALTWRRNNVCRYNAAGTRPGMKDATWEKRLWSSGSPGIGLSLCYIASPPI